MGKTAFHRIWLVMRLLTMAKVAFFSLEMDGEQLVQRVLCSRAQVK